MENQAQIKQQAIVEQFSQLKGWEDRYKLIIQVGKDLPKQKDELYQEKFLVKGCQSQVWLSASLNDEQKMILEADSDAMIVKGLVALLVEAYSGLSPQEVLNNPPDFIEKLGFKESLSPSRANGLVSMIKQIMLYAQAFSMMAKGSNES